MRQARGYLLLTLLLLAALPAFAQDIVRPKPQTTTGPWRFYVIGCTHFTSPIGGLNPARLRLSKMVEIINADSLAACLVLCGDHQFDQGTGETVLANEDWYVKMMTDTLQVPYLPVLGNHENEDENTTGTLYNRFITRFASSWFREYESQDQQGRRWACFRPKDRQTGRPVNAVFFLASNNAQDTTDVACYEVNNPAGYGYTDGDFDGIRDAASPQSVDCLACFTQNLESGDWPVIAQHRALRKLVSGVDSGVNARPAFPEMAQNGGHLDAVSDLVGRTLLVLEQDQHENKILGPDTGRWYLSAALALRDGDLTTIAALGDTLKAFVYGDTVKAGTVAADSLGVNADQQPVYPGTLQEQWSCLIRVTVDGSTATADLLLVQNHDATVVGATQEITLE